MKSLFRVILPVLFAVTNIHAFSQNKKTKVTLNHVAIYVVDLQKSTLFYRDIIGLDTMPEPFHDGRHTWFNVGEICHVHLIQGAAQTIAHDKNAHICFSVASIPEFINLLDKAGIDYEDWPGKHKAFTQRVDGVNQVYLKDPDGYWVEVNDAKY